MLSGEAFQAQVGVINIAIFTRENSRWQIARHMQIRKNLKDQLVAL